MSTLTPIDPGHVSENIQRILDKSAVTLEEVPNFLKLLATSPPALAAYVEMEEALSSGCLKQTWREQIAIAVSAINGSNYCTFAHSLAARDAGLPDPEIQRARKALSKDPKAQAILRFIEKVVLQRGRVGSADVLALRQSGFSQAEIIEMIANVAVTIFTNYLNIIAGTELDMVPLEARASR